MGGGGVNRTVVLAGRYVGKVVTFITKVSRYYEHAARTFIRISPT